MPATPSVRVVVRLPWNRPENPINDPPTIGWTPEKADILWKVIERSRASDSGGADWKGLAAHLEVPLPYLLYRVNARFQEEIRGLKDIQGALSPVPLQSAAKPPEEHIEKFSVAGRAASRLVESPRMASSSRLNTPLGVRARLNSLGNNSPRPRKATSSSTLTVQGVRKSHVPLQPTSPSSSEEMDSEDEAALKEEEADRTAEEQEALDRKLQELQRMMTNDALGLVSGKRPKGKGVDRGRMGPISSTSLSGSYRPDTLSSRSTSQSVSSASSPQGSIPDIPSSSGDSQSHSPVRRHLSSSKSFSPPAISDRGPHANTRRRHRPLVDRNSEYSSSHGSEASSFSDLSDASLSASALESALLSNIRGTTNGLRFSQFARSRLMGRGTGLTH